MKDKKAEQYGKCYVYECARCAAVCFRLLAKVPGACRNCGARLDARGRVLADAAVSVRGSDYVGRKMG